MPRSNPPSTLPALGEAALCLFSPTPLKSPKSHFFSASEREKASFGWRIGAKVAGGHEENCPEAPVRRGLTDEFGLHEFKNLFGFRHEVADMENNKIFSLTPLRGRGQK